MYSGEQIESHDSDFDSRVPGVVHRQTQNGEDLALLRTSRENVLSRHGHNGMEHHSFSSDNHNKMGNHEVNRPVQLTPSWEAQKHASEDHLNFRTLSVSMDRLDLEMNPPVDRLNLIYLTLILHGIGTLMPWNMFVTAKEYFANYKLGKEYTDTPLPYATY